MMKQNDIVTHTDGSYTGRIISDRSQSNLSIKILEGEPGKYKQGEVISVPVGELKKVELPPAQEFEWGDKVEHLICDYQGVVVDITGETLVVQITRSSSLIPAVGTRLCVRAREMRLIPKQVPLAEMKVLLPGGAVSRVAINKVISIVPGDRSLLHVHLADEVLEAEGISFK